MDSGGFAGFNLFLWIPVVFVDLDVFWWILVVLVILLFSMDFSVFRCIFVVLMDFGGFYGFNVFLWHFEFLWVFVVLWIWVVCDGFLWFWWAPGPPRRRTTPSNAPKGTVDGSHPSRSSPRAAQICTPSAHLGWHPHELSGFAGFMFFLWVILNRVWWFLFQWFWLVFIGFYRFLWFLMDFGGFWWIFVVLMIFMF